MRKSFWNWFPLLLWMGLIFLGSSISYATISPTSWIDFLLRKSLHIFEYAVLAALFARALITTGLSVRHSEFISESAARSSNFKAQMSNKIQSPKPNKFGLWPFRPRMLKWVRSVDRLAFFSPLVLSLLYALADEFHQSFVPGRTGCWQDVLVDALGAIIGLVVYSLNF